MTYGIAVMAPGFWHSDVSAEVNQTPSMAPSTSSVHVTGAGKPLSPLSSIRSNSIVNYTLRVDGLKAGWTMDWHGVALRIQGSNNQTSLGNAYGSGHDLRAAAAAAARAMLNREDRTTFTVPGALSLPHFDLESLRGSTARIEGSIRVMPRLYQVVQTLPLTPGTQRQKSGSRWRLVTTKEFPMGVGRQTDMRLWSVTVDAIIGSNPASRPEVFQMVLVNEPRQEMALPAFNQRSTSLSLGVLRIQRTEFAFARDYRVCPELYAGSGHELDEAWMRDATLLILSSSPGPAFSVPLLDDKATFVSVPAR
ncbi:MAG: hypothetical protein JNN01_00600 [Opitutaceae bacterium]|nr:hypothetical protein [Opitutaceae bacterium]